MRRLKSHISSFSPITMNHSIQVMPIKYSDCRENFFQHEQQSAELPCWPNWCVAQSLFNDLPSVVCNCPLPKLKRCGFRGLVSWLGIFWVVCGYFFSDLRKNWKCFGQLCSRRLRNLWAATMTLWCGFLMSPAVRRVWGAKALPNVRCLPQQESSWGESSRCFCAGHGAGQQRKECCLQ